MAISESTKWTIPPNSARTDLTPSLGGVIAQIRLITSGSTAEIDRRTKELGADDAQRRLRELMAGNERVRHYSRLRVEANGMGQQIHGLQATASRLYAERAELLAHAVTGFAAKVAAIDKKAADVEANIAEAQENREAIRTTLAAAKEGALRALQMAAGNVSAQLAWELRATRDIHVEVIAITLEPLLTEFAALERGCLVASGGSLFADLGGLLDSLAAKVEASDTPIVTPSPESPADAPDPVPEDSAADAPAVVPESPPSLPETGRCSQTKTDGQQCRGRALPGLAVCVLHRRAESRPVEAADASSVALTGA